MIVAVNLYGLEFRDVRDGQLVIYNGRPIAKVMKDETMIADTREVLRNAPVLESLAISRAMFVVEREKDFMDILEWQKIADFRKLTLNCYFLFKMQWLVQVLTELADNLQELKEMEITGSEKIDIVSFGEIVELFPNMESLTILGRSYER